MNPLIRGEWERLLSAACDQEMAELSAADAVRLRELLSSDAECRAFYIDYMDMHARLLVLERERAPVSSGGMPAAAVRISSLVRPAIPVASEGRVPRRGIMGLGRSEVLRLLLVAAGTLAASTLLQLDIFSGAGDGKRASTVAMNPITPVRLEYVATLMRSEDCRWDANHSAEFNVGSRLVPGEYQLVTGTAQIHLDGGAMMLVEGPASFQLGAANDLRLSSGKCVIAYDEIALPLDVRTPHSLLTADFGNFAVFVDGQVERLQVFEHDLLRSPKNGGQEVLLKAGEGRSFTVRDTAGDPWNAGHGFFRRSLPPIAVERSNEADIIAYESFDYRGATQLPFPGMPSDGIGWLDIWRHSSKTQPAQLRSENRLSNDDLTPRQGNMRLHSSAGTSLARDFEQPLVVNDDAVLYFSFLFNRRPTSNAAPNGLHLVLNSTEEEVSKDIRLGVYTNEEGQTIFCRTSGISISGPLPLRYNHTYRLAGKLVFSREHADQVAFSVFSADEKLKPEEPRNWMLTTPPANFGSSYRGVVLQFKGSSTQTFDEFRLGTTWASVALPRITVAEAESLQIQ